MITVARAGELEVDGGMVAVEDEGAGGLDSRERRLLSQSL